MSLIKMKYKQYIAFLFCYLVICWSDPLLTSQCCNTNYVENCVDDNGTCDVKDFAVYNIIHSAKATS